MNFTVRARLKAAALLLILLLCLPAPLCADVDYKEFQEDPLETAIRKLASPGGIEWDKEEMISGGAPDFIKDMKWPLKACKWGRGFSRKGRRHTGIDLLAPKGTPVLAVLDGVVEVVSNGGAGFRGYGKVIVINHSEKLWTLYSHNSSNEVKVGQRVKQGDMIAKVGRTGRATANHLHFEVRNAKGTPLDPMKYLPKEGAPKIR
ncbi:MAG: M23 family metallopeptidase [Synergistaceae bacterium]|nr:M23 family metallopeptidase [Synergistaceae bacterium]